MFGVLATLTWAPASPWSFDAGGELFGLASEERRMYDSHLADRFRLRF